MTPNAFSRRAVSRRVALLAALASSLVLAACGGGGSDSGQTTLRAVNLTSDLPSIDLFTGDTKRFSALARNSLSDNAGFNSQTTTLAVKRAGDGASLLSGSYSLDKDKHYTAVVWGNETGLRLTTLPEDENTNDITAGNSRVRVFNATTDTGSVDVYLTKAADIGGSVPTQGAITGGTLGGFRDVSTGAYRLVVTGVGDPNDVRLTIPAITLEEKKFATLVLTAGSGGVLVNGTLIRQQGTATALGNTQARVRVVASMNNAGVVAVTAAGRTLAGGLRSPSVGPYALVDAGTPDLTVRVNGAVIATGPRTLESGADYTVLTYGAEGAGQVRVIADDNRLPTTTSRAKIRLIHGVAGVGPLTLSVDFLALIPDVPSGTASGYGTVTSTTTAQVDVTSTSGSASLFSQTGVNLQGQAIYTVFILGGNATPTGVIRKER
ncbi:MAG: DUF4397 domain-containing protein [Rubrivivax sp.]